MGPAEYRRWSKKQRKKKKKKKKKKKSFLVKFAKKYNLA